MPTPPKLCGDCETQMDAMPDVYAMPRLDRDGKGGWGFSLNRVIPITVYMCPSCGRLKFISAMSLGNLEQDAE